MNQRQRAFCEAYLKSGNAAEAARQAGYSARTARSIGQRLLTYADIREYLAERNAEIMAENTATLEEIRSFWTATMRDQEAKLADRLKASELLSKALLLERSREEERAADGTENPFEALTTEELRRLAAMGEEALDEDLA